MVPQHHHTVHNTAHRRRRKSTVAKGKHAHAPASGTHAQQPPGNRVPCALGCGLSAASAALLAGCGASLVPAAAPLWSAILCGLSRECTRRSGQSSGLLRVPSGVLCAGTLHLAPPHAQVLDRCASHPPRDTIKSPRIVESMTSRVAARASCLPAFCCRALVGAATVGWGRKYQRTACSGAGCKAEGWRDCVSELCSWYMYTADAKPRPGHPIPSPAAPPASAVSASFFSRLPRIAWSEHRRTQQQQLRGVVPSSVRPHKHPGTGRQRWHSDQAESCVCMRGEWMCR